MPEPYLFFEALALALLLDRDGLAMSVIALSLLGVHKSLCRVLSAGLGKYCFPFGTLACHQGAPSKVVVHFARLSLILLGLDSEQCGLLVGFAALRILTRLFLFLWLAGVGVCMLPNPQL